MNNVTGGGELHIIIAGFRLVYSTISGPFHRGLVTNTWQHTEENDAPKRFRVGEEARDGENIVLPTKWRSVKPLHGCYLHLLLRLSAAMVRAPRTEPDFPTLHAKFVCFFFPPSSSADFHYRPYLIPRVLELLHSSIASSN